MESLGSLAPLILALVAVAAVLYLSYLFSKYLATGASKINRSKYIRIVDRVMLGQDRMLLITSIGDKYYLIGSSAQSIQILSELSAADMAEINVKSNGPEGGNTFQNTLKSMLSRKDK